MPISIEVSLGQLEPDLSNPRLPRRASDAQAAMRMLAKEDGPRLVKLAESIADHPWDSSNLPMLNTASNESGIGPYIVREGNRRLSALRGLASPDIFEGVLDPKEMKALRVASQRAALPTSIPCLWFAAEEEEDLLYRRELRHGGESAGAGVRPWDVRSRTRALGGDDVVAVTLLDFLDEEGNYGETSDIKPTTLTRLVSNPEIRKALGLPSGRNILPLPEGFSFEALEALLKYMRQPGFSVDAVKTAAQRRGLAEVLQSARKDRDAATTEGGESIAGPSDGNGVGESVAGSTEAAGASQNTGSSGGSGGSTASGASGGNAGTAGTSGATGTSGGAKSQNSTMRKSLVPKNFPTGSGRCLRIELLIDEAKSLDADKYKNIAAFTLRVLFELIIDEYRGRIELNEWDPLPKKAKTAGEHLYKRGLLTDQQMKAVEAMANDTTYGLTNMKTLHSYVHHKEAPVTGESIRHHWDQLDNFLRTAWENLP